MGFVHKLGTAMAMVVLASAAGCADAEEIFTSGRIENRCNGSIPVCGFQASCILTTDQYLRGEFPGGQRLIVRTEIDQARLRARFLLTEQRYPGTELFARAFSTGCSEYDEEKTLGEDIFDVIGAEGIVEYELDVEGRGDHMVEIFSDMSAAFLFLVEIDD